MHVEVENLHIYVVYIYLTVFLNWAAFFVIGILISCISLKVEGFFQ